jgi:hypothetical protein
MMMLPACGMRRSHGAPAARVAALSARVSAVFYPGLTYKHLMAGEQPGVDTPFIRTQEP